MKVAHISFEGALVSINKILSLVVDGHLADLAGHHGATAIKAAIQDQAPANPSSQRHANDVRQAKADSFEILILGVQSLDFGDDSIDQLSRIAILARVNNVPSLDNRAVPDDTNLYARAAKIDTDGCWRIHWGRLLRQIIRSPSRVRSGSTICNSGSFAAMSDA